MVEVVERRCGCEGVEGVLGQKEKSIRQAVEGDRFLGVSTPLMAGVKV
ncbi:MAG: hypothetical protein N3D14_04240 [Aquificaceae bacterium]|nr:hypothetical protein [Aquificaceae bacterium]MCX8164584.1 hypothetical protein [Aquificaceae bacterium]